MNCNSELEELIKVVEELRHPVHGCPWDLKQTHQSLLKYLIEESYEFIHAVEEKDTKAMEEELGDVLLQVLLHSTIAQENKHFSLNSLSKVLREKLIRRHPHVFSSPDSNIKVSDVVTNWEKIKEEEKAIKDSKGPQSLIDESYLRFPALFSSCRIGKKTQKINFDWSGPEEVITKVEEEWKEFKDELNKENNKVKLEEEFGDLLFSMAQLGRHLNFDPEQSLRDANKKFLRRFQKMEEKIQNDSKDIQNMNQSQMDVYWDKVKIDEKS